jgi:hypothetical protein
MLKPYYKLDEADNLVEVPAHVMMIDLTRGALSPSFSVSYYDTMYMKKRLMQWSQEALNADAMDVMGYMSHIPMDVRQRIVLYLTPVSSSFYTYLWDGHDRMMDLHYARLCDAIVSMLDEYHSWDEEGYQKRMIERLTIENECCKRYRILWNLLYRLEVSEDFAFCQRLPLYHIISNAIHAVIKKPHFP